MPKTNIQQLNITLSSFYSPSSPPRFLSGPHLLRCLFTPHPPFPVPSLFLILSLSITSLSFFSKVSSPHLFLSPPCFSLLALSYTHVSHSDNQCPLGRWGFLGLWEVFLCRNILRGFGGPRPKEPGGPLYWNFFALCNFVLNHPLSFWPTRLPPPSPAYSPWWTY